MAQQPEGSRHGSLQPSDRVELLGRCTQTGQGAEDGAFALSPPKCPESSWHGPEFGGGFFFAKRVKLAEVHLLVVRPLLRENMTARPPPRS